MRTMASLLDKTTGSIRDVYVARTGKNADQVKKWMDAETWFSAQDAVENGFATAISSNMKLAARVDLSKHRFAKLPEAMAATPNADALRERLGRMKAKYDRRSMAA
jgi:ATP-dependent Clp protease protease subunit